MNHGYANSDAMRGRMDAAGIPYRDLQVKEFCLTHSALWDDPVVQARMRTKLDAMPKPEFTVAKFMVLPFESGYWKNALRDGQAFEMFDEMLTEMSAVEKVELRKRVEEAR